MAEIVEVEDRVFDYYLRFPSDIRMKVIDQMEPNDRCRLTRCSKQCNKEAKASKNYIHKLGVRFCANSLRIFVIYQKLEDDVDLQHGFRLEFYRRAGNKFLKYESLDNQVLWTIELDNSTDLVRYGLEEFKNYLNCYQDTIKVLEIGESWITNHGIDLEDIDFKIKSLKNLESLTLTTPIDASQIFSKLKHPLKYLSVCRLPKVMQYEQIYQVQDTLRCWGVELDNEQFLRLSAKEITMKMGRLTEKDVFKFVRSWQNGTIGKKINSCSWHLEGSNFDYQKLLKLLRYKNPDSAEDMQIEIKHYKKGGKSAKLQISDRELEFSI